MATMHVGFADWYRAATVEPDQQLLEVRWNGVDTALANLDVDGAIDMVRLYFGVRASEQSFVNSFRQAFKSADAAFPMSSNDLELRVLAGSSLFQLLEKPGRIADVAALALKTGHCQGAVSSNILPELVSSASEYLVVRSHKVREFSPAKDIPRLKKLNVEGYRQVFAGSDISQIFQPITDMISSIVEGVDGGLAAAQRAMKTISSNQQSLQEEVDILWWIFGEHSTDLKSRLSTIPVAPGLLIVAKELADHTTGTLGVPAARAFLDKAVRSLKGRAPASVPVKDAINGTDRDWRRSVSVDSVGMFNELIPFHLAAEKSLLTDGDDDWVPVFEKAAPIKADWRTKPLNVAAQFYNERILTRLYNQAK